MGDSTCLMQQPFCYASGISNEANENNPIHALGQSISFGRFMSESLAWEKWSTFSHNRYVEEAERYSRPGSVAQKKAFFEAHYKKLAAQKAAALLEQANNGAQNNATVTHQKDNDTVTHQNDSVTVNHNSQTSPNSEMVVEVEQDANVLTVTPESVKVEGTEAEMEEVAVVGNSMEVELQNQVEDLDDAQREQNEKLSVNVTPVLTPLAKQVSISDQEVLADVGNKKPPVSSFKLSSKANNGTSKFTSTPVKSTAAISYKKENIASPISIKPANGTSKFTTTPVKPTAATSFKRDNIASPMSNRPSKFTATPIKSAAAISFRRDNIVTPVNNMPVGLNTADKKRSTPRSVNFTPIRELNRLTASVMRKFESTRVGAGPSKASKDNLTPMRTPTMASKEIQKHTLTPLTEKKGNKTPLDLSSAPRSHTGGPKWNFLSGENRMKSPLISSPFSLRTEERAARRKKKLEEKFNANEAQKVQLQTKHKEKTETEIIRKLRQSFCFKARPLPDFYKERKTSKGETKKDLLTHSETPKDGRKSTPTMAENKTYFPPNRPVLKTSGTKHFQGKSGRTLTHPLTSTSHVIPTHENASPNIQHGYLHSRDYKY
ncbi:protein WVD2-like 4 isoform X1 [Vigna unguiculata]|uniref:protein WVD2-like 4 isoform X1 n=2 Tax=Vigna unguiculata TaxID=3917 RepID=UPI0010160901|nr:protein WVD2-like 4 isoform X1 [Vigna unguiculata]